MQLYLKTPACSSAPRLEIEAAFLIPCGSDAPGTSGWPLSLMWFQTASFWLSCDFREQGCSLSPWCNNSIVYMFMIHKRHIHVLKKVFILLKSKMIQSGLQQVPYYKSLGGWINLNKFPPGVNRASVFPTRQPWGHPTSKPRIFLCLGDLLAEVWKCKEISQLKLYWLLGEEKNNFWKPLWSTVQLLKNLHGHYFIWSYT